jgi:Major Vault Protein repeat domain
MPARIEIGPCNFIKQENEQIIKQPTDMIKLPPNHYCIIKNPIVRDEDGEIVRNKDFLSMIRLRVSSERARSALKSLRSEDKKITLIHSLCILMSSYTKMSRNIFSLRIMRLLSFAHSDLSLTCVTEKSSVLLMMSICSRDQALTLLALKKRLSNELRL